MDNYYNHTFATYPGIYGTLTSLYPYKGMPWVYIKEIKENKAIKPEVSSLYGILKENGYQNYFIDSDDESFLISHMIKNMIGGVESVYDNTNKTLLSSYNSKFNERTHYLFDEDIFDAIKILLQKDNHPKSISAYFLGTHYNVDSRSQRNPVIYGNGGDIFLNALHHFDHQFGQFMEWFKQSQYYENTLIILTTDNAPVHSKEYMNLLNQNPEIVRKDFVPTFYDKTPFLIYSKAIPLPKYVNAHYTTSLNFTPTLLHILGYKNHDNVFLGDTLLNPLPNDIQILMTGESFSFYILDKKIHPIKQYDNKERLSPEKIKLQQKINQIRLQQKLFYENKLFVKNKEKE